MAIDLKLIAERGAKQAAAAQRRAESARTTRIAAHKKIIAAAEKARQQKIRRRVVASPLIPSVTAPPQKGLIPAAEEPKQKEFFFRGPGDTFIRSTTQQPGQTEITREEFESGKARAERRKLAAEAAAAGLPKGARIVSRRESTQAEVEASLSAEERAMLDRIRSSQASREGRTFTGPSGVPMTPEQLFFAKRGREEVIKFEAPGINLVKAVEEKPFIFTVELEKSPATAKQARALRAQARKKSIDIDIISKPEEEKIVFELRSPRELEEGEFKIPTGAAITERRIRMGSEVLAERAFGKATEQEKALLGLRTILAPRGFEFIGATLQGKPTEDVVKEKLAEEIRIAYTVPESDIATAFRGITEFVGSPVFEVEAAFAIGAFTAAAGATKFGAKVLATKAAKIGLVGAGGLFIGGRGVEVASLVSAGRIDEAVGKAFVTGASIAAGIAGFKLQTAHIATPPTEVVIDITKVKGVTATVKKGKIFETRGQFVVEEPEAVRGLEGIIQAVGKKTGKVTKSRVTAFVPRQKVGKVIVETAVSTRRATGKAVPGTKGKVQIAKTKDIIDYRTGQTLSIETSRIKTGDVLIRKFETLGAEVTPKKFQLQVLKRGDVVAKLVTKKGISRVDVQAGEFIDISRIAPITKVTISRPSTGITKPVTAVKAETIPAPPKISVKIITPKTELTKIGAAATQAATGIARVITPKLLESKVIQIKKTKIIHVTDTKVRAREIVAEKEKLKIGVTPIQAQIIKSLKRSDMLQEQIARTIQITRQDQTQDQTQDQISKSLQASRITQKQITEQATEVITEPVPFIPVPKIGIKPPRAGLPIIPYARLTPGTLKVQKFGVKFLIHDIPTAHEILFGKQRVTKIVV